MPSILALFKLALKDVHFGDLPTWLAGIGTVAAFGVALWLLFLQLRDRRASETERLRSQARLVSAWTTDVELNQQPFPVVVVLIRNNSTEPVFDVILRLPVGVRGTYVRRAGSVGPGETLEFRIQIAGFPHDTPIPELYFVDSAGARWIRHSRGQLNEPTIPETMVFGSEDPGAYDSIDTNPALMLELSEEERRGRKLT